MDPVSRSRNKSSPRLPNTANGSKPTASIPTTPVASNANQVGSTLYSSPKHTFQLL